MPKSPLGWKQIAQKYEENTHFRHCIGSLDGRHMVITNPYHAGSTYINYKGTFSIVLMGMCDSEYCFTYANIGAQGRISDGGVFNNCSLSRKLAQETLHLPPPEPLADERKSVPYVIVADNAFGLKKNLMVPYPGHEKLKADTPERIFNYRLSAARSRIENTFGIMTAVFRVFRRPMNLQPEKARIIIECCVLLHNFLMKSRNSQNKYAPQGTFDTGGNNGSWRNDEPATSAFPLVRYGRKPKETAKDIRNEFAAFYMSPEGRVPWQDQYQ